MESIPSLRTWDWLVCELTNGSAYNPCDLLHEPPACLSVPLQLIYTYYLTLVDVACFISMSRGQMCRMTRLDVRWEASKPNHANSHPASLVRVPRRLPRRTLGEATRDAGLVLGD